MVDELRNAQWSALVVDDDPGVRQSLRLCLETEDARVLGVGSATAAIEALKHGWFDVVFLDLWLGKESGMDAIQEMRAIQPHAGIVVVTAYASFESAVRAMRLGAADYLPKPFAPEQVRHAARKVVESSALQRRVLELQARVDAAEGGITFKTQSALQRELLERAARAAASDAVVLLRGESGTGKSVLARWMVRRSARNDRPFVTVHCPMLSGDDAMVGALFGRCNDASPPGPPTPGKVEEAHGGTLFLDEIGDLTLEGQARLLRFLNDRTYERLGETRERKAEVRIIAATSRELEKDVASGRFRSDLFFRLDVIALTLPPLRERREDIVPLAWNYLRFYERAQGRHGLAFSERCKQVMSAHTWPGNLRELRNAVERAVILSSDTLLEAPDLGLAETRPARAEDRSEPVPLLGAEVSLQAVEREHIARVVARSPSLEAAARVLDIDPSTLQRKRKRYGLV